MTVAVNVPASRPRRRRCLGAAGAGLLALGLALTACGAPGAAVLATGHARTAPTTGGQFTRLDGTVATVGAYRGRPTVVWFVAGGCASCAVSIPKVGAALPAFARAGAHVLALGLYGAFGAQRGALTQLAAFSRAAAGSSWRSPTWTWGLASKALTLAYDPTGLPDAYFLLTPTGRVAFHDAVPATTLPTLLRHLRRLGRRHA